MLVLALGVMDVSSFSCNFFPTLASCEFFVQAIDLLQKNQDNAKASLEVLAADMQFLMQVLMMPKIIYLIMVVIIKTGENLNHASFDDAKKNLLDNGCHHQKGRKCECMNTSF